MGRFSAALLTALSAALALAPHTAEAQECPNAQTSRDGFVVERGSAARSEILRDGANVRSIYRVSGTVLLETTQFEGLFELERLDRGRRSSFKPKSELARLFPLKVGQRSLVEFESNLAGMPPAKRTIGLRVIGTDELYLGKCKYKVLKIERSQSQGEAPPIFIDFEYYAPDLKLVIAKEFKERNGQTTMNKFDKIYPVRN